jgi:hypothetical protein
MVLVPRDRAYVAATDRTDGSAVAEPDVVAVPATSTEGWMSVQELLQEILHWPDETQRLIRERVGRLTRWRGSIVYITAVDVYDSHPSHQISRLRLHIATPPPDAPKHFVPTAFEVWEALRACEAPELVPPEPEAVGDELRRHLEDLGIVTIEHELSSIEELIETFSPVCNHETCTECA